MITNTHPNTSKAFTNISESKLNKISAVEQAIWILINKAKPLR